MTYEEKVSLYGFALAILLAVLQPLYAPYTKGPQWSWLKPTQLFCIIPLLMLFWPARNAKDETILSVKALRDHFPITILFMWPASVALSKILSTTGAGSRLSSASMTPCPSWPGAWPPTPCPR